MVTREANLLVESNFSKIQLLSETTKVKLSIYIKDTNMDKKNWLSHDNQSFY